MFKCRVSLPSVTLGTQAVSLASPPSIWKPLSLMKTENPTTMILNEWTSAGGSDSDKLCWSSSKAQFKDSLTWKRKRRKNKGSEGGRRGGKRTNEPRWLTKHLRWRIKSVCVCVCVSLRLNTDLTLREKRLCSLLYKLWIQSVSFTVDT